MLPIELSWKFEIYDKYWFQQLGFGGGWRVFPGPGRAQLQLAVDWQCLQEHGLRAVLVEENGADAHPAAFLVGAGPVERGSLGKEGFISS